MAPEGQPTPRKKANYENVFSFTNSTVRILWTPKQRHEYFNATVFIIGFNRFKTSTVKLVRPYSV